MRNSPPSRRFTAFVALSLAGAVLLGGCGTSKPAYCTQVSNFEDSVKALEKEEISLSNASGVTTAVKNIGTSVQELGSAVKSEFAPQTSAIRSSFGALEKSVNELLSASGTSALGHAITAIPKELESLKHATTQIQEVTKSKCK
jgi:hypothetical protein